MGCCTFLQGNQEVKCKIQKLFRTPNSIGFPIVPYGHNSTIWDYELNPSELFPHTTASVKGWCSPGCDAANAKSLQLWQRRAQLEQRAACSPTQSLGIGEGGGDCALFLHYSSTIIDCFTHKQMNKPSI